MSAGSSRLLSRQRNPLHVRHQKRGERAGTVPDPARLLDTPSGGVLACIV